LRTQISSAIAAVAKIDVPRKEWLELIPTLCQNASHESIDIRNAAL
jgi:hypothetical protein